MLEKTLKRSATVHYVAADCAAIARRTVLLHRLLLHMMSFLARPMQILVSWAMLAHPTASA
jgi:hypothetical protein